MAFQSVWYFTDLPEEIVNIIEKDLFDSFGERMSDSKIQEGNLNKEKEIQRMHGFLLHIG